MAIPTDPVTAPDGRVYSRQALAEWLAVRGTSPFTREPMTMADVHENLHITEACNRLLADQSDGLAPSMGLALSHFARDAPDAYTDHLVAVTPSDAVYCAPGERFVPSDLVILVDTSGSTGQGVRAQDDENNQLTDGLRIIDLIRHSVATVAATLAQVPGARLGVVAFSGSSRVLLPLTTMTPGARSEPPREILPALRELVPSGPTDLWGGLKTALDLVAGSVERHPGRRPAVMLLTDGVPTTAPSRPMREALDAKMAQVGCRCPIHAFGFGTALHRDLLTDIAAVSGGIMAGVPDGGFLGTVFSHAVANTLATCATDARLHVRYRAQGDVASSPPSLLRVLDIEPEADDTAVVTYQLGCIQEGQARSASIRTPEGVELVSAWCTYVAGGQHHSTPQLDLLSEPGRGSDGDWSRVLACWELDRLGRLRRTARAEPDISNVCAAAQTYLSCAPVDAAVQSTWDDQVGLALSAQYYRSWGWIYIDQLRSALLNDVCPNFKDAMLQRYGGRYRRAVTDLASDLFDDLVLPREDPPPQMIYGATRSMRPQPVAPVSMASYNRVSSGCFTAQSRLRAADGSWVTFGGVRVGHLVESADGGAAQVRAVLKIVHPQARCDLTTLEDGCECTPWHPVRTAEGQWVPAREYPGARTRFRSCPATYSLVLTGGHGVVVAGTADHPVCAAASLAHGQREKGLYHPFWGDTVLEDMSAHPHYPYVTVPSTAFLRGLDGDVVALSSRAITSSVRTTADGGVSVRSPEAPADAVPSHTPY